MIGVVFPVIRCSLKKILNLLQKHPRKLDSITKLSEFDLDLDFDDLRIRIGKLSVIKHHIQHNYWPIDFKLKEKDKGKLSKSRVYHRLKGCFHLLNKK